MKKYKNPEPVFSDEIDVYEDADPVDAESVDNVPLKQLADNDNALKKQMDSISLADMSAVESLADEIRQEAMAAAHSGGGEADARTATDEEVDDAIEGLDDL